MKKCFIILLNLCLIKENISVAQTINYPEARKSDQKDNYHGTLVEDPYRWMEDTSIETKAWIQMENELTFDNIHKIPFRHKISDRLKELYDYQKYNSPIFRNSHYFFFFNSGLKNQSVLYVQKKPGVNPEVLLDPNIIAADGTISISQIKISHDGRYLAYALSKAGSDWNEIRIKEVETGNDLQEVLGQIKFSQIAWYKNGFYYSRYDKQVEGIKKNEFHKVYYHQLNTEQSVDMLIYEDKKHPLRNFSAAVSEDERYLIISGSESTSGNNLMVKKLTKPDSPLLTLANNFSFDYDYIDNNGDSLFFLTNNDASNNRVVFFNMSDTVNMGMYELVSQNKDVLIGVTRAGYKYILKYMHNASHVLKVFNLVFRPETDIPVDGLVTIEDVIGDKNDSLVFFSVSSFLIPPTVYYYSLVTKKSSVYFDPHLKFNANEYTTNQLSYFSKDSTLIPMFITYKAGIELTGDIPILLFGYGGFNISKTPEFKPERLLFIESGGIFAMPNLRGGGEFGEEWHQAGTKLNKQNVFDDFIAAAEYLSNYGFTNRNKIAIQGRSNGGLLVGAAMTQRPDLFKVALPAVGVMDMLRFHKFTIGWSWTSDYGSSDNPQEFQAIYKYSPLHNIKNGVKYPATLVTTADHDDRVVPAHSYKFIASLQDKGSKENPYLIRIDTDAGHGAGKPTGKLIDEQTDIFSFLFYQLNMVPK